jgi:hypothetical protein
MASIRRRLAWLDGPPQDKGKGRATDGGDDDATAAPPVRAALVPEKRPSTADEIAVEKEDLEGLLASLQNKVRKTARPSPSVCHDTRTLTRVGRPAPGGRSQRGGGRERRELASAGRATESRARHHRRVWGRGSGAEPSGHRRLVRASSGTSAGASASERPQWPGAQAQGPSRNPDRAQRR